MARLFGGRSKQLSAEENLVFFQARSEPARSSRICPAAGISLSKARASASSEGCSAGMNSFFGRRGLSARLCSLVIFTALCETEHTALASILPQADGSAVGLEVGCTDHDRIRFLSRCRQITDHRGENSNVAGRAVPTFQALLLSGRNPMPSATANRPPRTFLIFPLLKS